MESDSIMRLERRDVGREMFVHCVLKHFRGDDYGRNNRDQYHADVATLWRILEDFEGHRVAEIQNLHGLLNDYAAVTVRPFRVEAEVLAKQEAG